MLPTPTEGDVRLHFEGQGRTFSAPTEIVAATTLDGVLPALAAVEKAVQAGAWAAGYVAYEAAPAFDAALTTPSAGPLPLLWFGLYSEPQPFQLGNAAKGATPGPWEPLVSEADYMRAIETIRAHLAAGDTYQVNYTFPMRAAFHGDPYPWFERLCAAQGRGYFGYLDTGRFKMLSASPELFYACAGGRLLTRPMKGTRPRGRFPAEDRALAEALRASEKERAENLMIVDLLRNDLGRIAQFGSVDVEALFAVERYETVWQMTSTIAARTRATLTEQFRALFPCGSVTGAPKAETMKIIRALEPHPRGVYCGAIGFAAPGGHTAFNVAIRTAVVDAQRGEAEYHVGGGITWDAAAAPEYAECHSKAAILSFRRPKFDLLESLLFHDGYFLLEAHLERLAASAAYFGYACDVNDVRAALLKHAEEIADTPAKVRLLLNRHGEPHIAHDTLPPPKPWHVGLAPEPVSSRDVFLFHKTTHRAVYEQARAARPECDDVLLWNERGELTEATMGNLVLELEGGFCTPPLDGGLLAGVYRGQLLREGALQERVLNKDLLAQARGIRLINSVRKWIEVEWVD